MTRFAAASSFDPAALPWGGAAAVGGDRAARPVIGVMCCNRTVERRRAQAVANRFVEPLARLSGASVLLVPAIEDAVDARAFAGSLDGLLLTGACSNVAAARYGAEPSTDEALDEGRDAVALALAARMIEAGRPVFGICRGLQELNVLFGGTLADVDEDESGHHHARDAGDALDQLFGHRHAIDVSVDGVLAAAIGGGRISVNSVHRQGIDRLGTGLSIEAVSPDDGLIEAISARPCGAPVLGVQWHPEWDVAERRHSRDLFALIGDIVQDPKHRR